MGLKESESYLDNVEESLRALLRQYDEVTRPCRGEFAILLPYCETDNALRIAERAKQSCRSYDGEDKLQETSVGVIPVSPKGDNLHLARMISKGASKGISLLSDTTTPAYRAVRDIRDALEENRFQLHFQEIKSLSDDTAGDSYEILLRMYDRKGKLISPTEFIPLAEHHGLMPYIDLWVVEKFLSSYTSIYNEVSGRKLRKAAINLSGKTLSNKVARERILDSISQYEVPPEKICFEITETASISDPAAAKEFIEALKAKGCTIGLDDFGKGFSNYDYLRRLPIDYIKIDGGLIRHVSDDMIDKAIVSGIIEIARMMNMQTVAEFVSTSEILDCVMEMGVDHVQGWAIGKAEPLFERYC